MATLSGPLFDGRAEHEFQAMALGVEAQVAAQASAYVHTILDQKIKVPTPYYETQITTQRAGGSTVVHDRGIVYGPWLEGVSSRNRTTRFKGYAAFRTATQLVERQVQRLAAPVVDRHVGRMQ